MSNERYAVVDTASGAEYVIDRKEHVVTRVGPYSSGIDYVNTPDAERLPYWYYCPYPVDDSGVDIEVGKSLFFELVGGRFRLTTPVTYVDYTDEENN